MFPNGTSNKSEIENPKSEINNDLELRLQIKVLKIPNPKS
ncbi:MAG: hypothetical protein JWP44_3032 [Mucilaginibacter sp.]|nr:hypothetical protein [Mucilaginibacter sp.]